MKVCLVAFRKGVPPMTVSAQILRRTDVLRFIEESDEVWCSLTVGMCPRRALGLQNCTMHWQHPDNMVLDFRKDKIVAVVKSDNGKVVFVRLFKEVPNEGK